MGNSIIYGVLEENEQFSIRMVKDKLLFSWNEIQLLTADDYKYALSRIAFYCSQQTPLAIIIDKLKFQPKISFDKYWYNQHILPSYHKTGIEYLGHVTGNVKGHNQLPISEEFNFKIIEFESLVEALGWKENNK